MRRVSLSAVLVFAVAALAPAPLAAQALSRAEAVSAALNVNPDVVRAREDLNILEGQITEVKADAMPEVTFRANATRYRDPAFLNSPSFDGFPPDLLESLKPVAANLFDGAAEIKQTLYSFKVGRALKAARLQRTLGQEEARRARQSIALEAVRAYNSLLVMVEYVRINQRTLEQKNEHLTNVRNRRAAGVATELDVLRSEVDVENQRAMLVRSEGRVDLARATLNAVMLRPINTPIEPTDTLEGTPLPQTLEQALEAAVAERPEVKAASIDEKVRDEIIAIERAERMPVFDFSATYGWNVREADNFFRNDYTKWTTGVFVTVPIFDGGRSKGRIAQAQAQRAKATQSRLAAENQVRLETTDAFDRLTVAARLLRAADLNITQAKRALDMTRANYGLGAATQLDVTDAQQALTEAERVRVDALHDGADARATLRYAMGLEPVDGLTGQTGGAK
jgi:outer membrane protein TolC